MPHKIMFSLHVGNSVAHILRTRHLAQLLLRNGYDVVYPMPDRALRCVAGFVPQTSIRSNEQNYSYASAPFKDHLAEGFVRHAHREYDIFLKEKPALLIGDTGLVAHSYRPEVPFVKILKRFYIEVGVPSMASPYNPRQRQTIREDAEGLVNLARRRIGLSESFTYSDFISDHVVVNGADSLLPDLPRGYIRAGMTMEMKTHPQPARTPTACLLQLGTGFDELHHVGLAQHIVDIVTPLFKRVYVCCGNVIAPRTLRVPESVVLQRMLAVIPDDVGIVVSHGSYASVHLALKAGLPIVTMPFQIEHFSNAWHIQRLNRGLSLGTLGDGPFRGLFHRVGVGTDRLRDIIVGMQAVPDSARFMPQAMQSRIESVVQELVHKVL